MTDLTDLRPQGACGDSFDDWYERLPTDPAFFNLRGPVSTPRARLVATQILEACALADRHPRTSVTPTSRTAEG